MDAIKILGDLLGNRQMSRGRGQHVIKSILGGGVGSVPQRPPRRTRPQPIPQGHSHHGPVGNNPLGGLIRAAVEQFTRRGDSGHQHREHERQHRREHEHYQAPPPPLDSGSCPGFPDDRDQANWQAKLLIRAMINAAKSDGQVDQQEQDQIIGKMGHLSQDEVQFLRYEFAQPLDVRALAREVPQGLEDEVYSVSLTAIDLDTNQEARYLHDLAHELGLSHQECNRIHAHFGAPQIFR